MAGIEDLPPGIERLPPSAQDPYAECRPLIDALLGSPGLLAAMLDVARWDGAEVAAATFAEEVGTWEEARAEPAVAEAMRQQLASPAFHRWLRGLLGAT